jgi:hypothetical protein
MKLVLLNIQILFIFWDETNKRPRELEQMVDEGEPPPSCWRTTTASRSFGSKGGQKRRPARRED